jgi:hypothetical protein
MCTSVIKCLVYYVKYCEISNTIHRRIIIISRFNRCNIKAIIIVMNIGYLVLQHSDRSLSFSFIPSKIFLQMIFVKLFF